MALVKHKPKPSSRMGITLGYSGVEGLSVLEYGSMGHTLYQYKMAGVLGQVVKCQYFSTHLSEKDIIMGSQSRLERALVHLLKEEKTQAIAVVPSSSLEITGFDLKAEVALIMSGDLENEKDVKVFTTGKGGLQYTFEEGLEEGLWALISTLSSPRNQTEVRPFKAFNLLGGFGFEGPLLDLVATRKRLEDHYGGRVFTAVPLETDISHIKKLTTADFNVVLGDEALKTAQWLLQAYDMPYFVPSIELLVFKEE